MVQIDEKWLEYEIDIFKWGYHTDMNDYNIHWGEINIKQFKNDWDKKFKHLSIIKDYPIYKRNFIKELKKYTIKLNPKF